MSPSWCQSKNSATNNLTGSQTNWSNNITEASFVSFSGWFRMTLVWWKIPPLFKKIVPTTTCVLANVRPIVQWAAVKTHLLVKILPPQKWLLSDERNETWYGTCPWTALLPPTTNDEDGLLIAYFSLQRGTPKVKLKSIAIYWMFCNVFYSKLKS